MKKFDIFYDKSGVSGRPNSYWIVAMGNDEELFLGRLGPFNTHCDLDCTAEMSYVGNYGGDNSLGDLWKTNPPVMASDI